MRAWLPVMLLVVLALASPARAAEYHLIRWTLNARCEILVRPPAIGTFWQEIGTFPSRREAENALTGLRSRKECAAAPETPPRKPVLHKPAPRKPARVTPPTG